MALVKLVNGGSTMETSEYLAKQLEGMGWKRVSEAAEAETEPNEVEEAETEPQTYSKKNKHK